ncbi:Guanine nucleotide-binding protein G(O) subunit alpha [Aphelenchoides fujianensis]|nr:Guanine nucleotide-binding protein G(O) subunit alpha [Aphelenchoides fujianensis]
MGNCQPNGPKDLAGARPSAAAHLPPTAVPPAASSSDAENRNPASDATTGGSRRARMTTTVTPEMLNSCQSPSSSDDPSSGGTAKPAEISRRIDAMLVKEHRASERVVKMLLLGPSESGKSTVLKQMKIIHCNGFSEQERATRRSLIFENVVQSMHQLLVGMRRLGIPFTPQVEEDAKTINDAHLDLQCVENSLPDDVYDACKRLWNDQRIIEAYGRRSEFHLIDCAKYFLDDIDRVKTPDYIPTVQDMLYARQETIGVSEVRYIYKNMDFRIFDVGGQKTERRKWLHLFDNVNCLFFIAAISEYDQKMREDDETNRLLDAMELFSGVANNPLFASVQLILFLNKQDLFGEKIRRIPLTACFPNYRQGTERTDENKNDFKNASLYITRKFEKQIADKQKMIYTHLTAKQGSYFILHCGPCGFSRLSMLLVCLGPWAAMASGVLLALLVAGCAKKPPQTTGASKQTNEKVSGDPKKKDYKPGHLPEFADPDEKNTETLYNLNSALAFPPKNPDGTLVNANSPRVSVAVAANPVVPQSEYAKPMEPSAANAPKPEVAANPPPASAAPPPAAAAPAPAKT